MSNNQIKISFIMVEKALKALKVAIDAPTQSNNLHIDATIQRFEFSIELF